MLVVSCTQEVEEKNEGVIQVENEEKCDPLTSEGFLGLINSNSIGIITVNTEIPSLTDHVGYELQTVEQIVASKEGAEEYVTVYHLFYNMTEVMNMRGFKDESSKIASLTTYDSRFKTNECISVGSTSEELLKAYTVNSVFMNFEEHSVNVFCNELGGVSFTFAADVIKNLELVNSTSGQVELDNVALKGSIISISIYQ